MSKNSVGFIVLGIISIASFVLGGYSFLTTQIFVEPEESRSKLVGIWMGSTLAMTTVLIIQLPTGFFNFLIILTLIQNILVLITLVRVLP